MVKIRLNRTARVLLATLIFLACGAVGFYQTYQPADTFLPQTEQFLTCKNTLSENQRWFQVYLTDESIAEMALPKLCKNTVIQRQFGNVKVTIGHNDYDTYRFINHGVPELTLVKSNVMSSFSADMIYGYDNIASHMDYNAYFIALREKPKLSKEYLLGKRIGILDYPSSRSGHIVPKTVLQRLGLSDDNVNIKYYNSHQELRKGLLAGDVDIISSYWGKGDEEQLSKSYITALEDTVSGMRWYMKMQTRNTDLRCALQDVIKQIAQSHPRSYYQTVEMVGECSND